MQCQAKKKRTDEQCQRRAVVGKSVCTVHGGLTPSGLASTHYRTGRYSRDLPSRLVDRYQEAKSDPDLLSMREEVVLLDSRIMDVLSRVDTGESGRIWTTLKAAAAELRYAQVRHDNDAAAIALNSMLDLVRLGHQDYAAWTDVRSLLEQRRRTVESESKRLQQMQQMVTTERLMLFVGALAQVVRDSIFANVQDRDQARRALADASSGIERLISAGSSSATSGEPVDDRR